MKVKEKFVFWKYENVKKIYDQANATKKRAKLLLRHYIYQHSDTNIQQNIVPLLCETFMNTHNFMKYLDTLMIEENITEDKDGKKNITVYQSELQVLQLMSTANLLCEHDLSNYTISLKEH